jgi:antitoxin MazE
MRVHIKKWGNSASVRIPATVMSAARLKLDAAVDVRAENGRIVIKPVRVKEYNVNRLIRAITPTNLHKDADFGPAVGRETL